MSLLARVGVICGGAILTMIFAIGAMHEPRHQQVQIHEAVAEDYDFLMHDMEVAREQARDAYERITATDKLITDANRRVMFDNNSLWDSQ